MVSIINDINITNLKSVDIVWSISMKNVHFTYQFADKM